jgi:hypothetical protein
MNPQPGESVLLIKEITVDVEVQDRAEMNAEVVAEYAASDLNSFPAVRVWDDGKTKWLSSGHHTLAAHKKQGRVDIRAVVFLGTREDAILDAVRSNTKHGLRRSGKDKRRAVQQLLKAFPEMSDRQLMEEAQVSADLVGSVRQEIAGTAQAHDRALAQTKRRTTRNKRRQPASKKDAQRQRARIRELILKDPSRASRDIAKEVRCSSRTVDDERKQMETERKTTSTSDPATNGTPPAEERGDAWEPPTDKEGHLVPPACAAAFENIAKYEAIDRLLQEVQSGIDELSRLPGGEQLRQWLNPTGSAGKTVNKSDHLEALKRDLCGTRPHSVCPYCAGQPAPGCRGCQGAGWVTLTTWKDAPEEVKGRLKKCWD